MTQRLKRRSLVTLRESRVNAAERGSRKHAARHAEHSWCPESIAHDRYSRRDWRALKRNIIIGKGVYLIGGITLFNAILFGGINYELRSFIEFVKRNNLEIDDISSEQLEAISL